MASSNVMHYVNIVRKKSLLRTLIQNSQEIIESCFNEEDDAEIILEQAEQRIFNVSVLRKTDELKKIGELLVDTIREIETLMKNRNSVTGVPSGLIDLDKKTTGFHPGQLIIIGGRPGMGKTSLALNIAQKVGIHEKRNVVYFSLEMSGQELTSRILCSEALVNSTKIRTGYINDSEFVRLLQVQNEFREAPIYIDDNPQTTVLEIRAKLLRLTRKVKKIDLVIVDYLQLMRSSGSKRSEGRWQDLAEISRSLKGIAREIEVPIIALTQLSRAVEHRQDQEPRLADIRESGAIEQDADIVIFIHKRESSFEANGKYGKIKEDEGFPMKDEGTEAYELIIAKHRSGPMGRIPVIFLKNYTRFESSALMDENIYNLR
jgi:replicative DNA helicase